MVEHLFNQLLYQWGSGLMFCEFLPTGHVICSSNWGATWKSSLMMMMIMDSADLALVNNWLLQTVNTATLRVPVGYFPLVAPVHSESPHPWRCLCRWWQPYRRRRCSDWAPRRRCRPPLCGSWTWAGGWSWCLQTSGRGSSAEARDASLNWTARDMKTRAGGRCSPVCRGGGSRSRRSSGRGHGLSSRPPACCHGNPADSYCYYCCSRGHRCGDHLTEKQNEG